MKAALPLLLVCGIVAAVWAAYSSDIPTARARWAWEHVRSQVERPGEAAVGMKGPARQLKNGNWYAEGTVKRIKTNARWCVVWNHEAKRVHYWLIEDREGGDLLSALGSEYASTETRPRQRLTWSDALGRYIQHDENVSPWVSAGLNAASSNRIPDPVPRSASGDIQQQWGWDKAGSSLDQRARR